VGFYNKFILPGLIDCACSSKPIMKQREKVVPYAEGVVLEVGCGSGTNFSLYDRSKVKKVYALEPAAEMIAKASGRPEAYDGLDLSFLEAGGEAVPLETNTVDTVMFTFTLCTIPDWSGALNEARRVLKPGGKLYYSEHGGAPDAGVAKWQRRLEPFQKVLAGGCHLTRIPTDMLIASGFRIDDGHTMYLPGTPKPMGFAYWGHASIA
jgi:SAM-dependent methyltransferase